MAGRSVCLVVGLGVVFRCAAGGGSEALASTSVYSITEVASGSLGYSVASAGDVNGDGFDDVIVGSPHHSGQGFFLNGSVRVISGIDGSTLFTLYGQANFDRFGWSVAGGVDFDQDGHPDIVVGAPQIGSTTAGGNPGPGYVQVFSGLSGQPILAAPLTNGVSDSRFGSSVAAFRQFPGGPPCLLIGAPNLSVSANPWWLGAALGAAYLYCGAIAPGLVYTWSGTQALASFGHAVSRAGDVNEDGYEDVIVGTQNGNAATIYSGQNGQVLLALSEPATTGYGSAVSPLGDVDQDGHADVLVGAPGAGLARIVSGATGAVLRTLAGPPAALDFGFSVGVVPAPGDLDGDHVPDVLVGSPHQSGGAPGRVSAFSGQSGLLLFEIAGTAAGDGFGFSVAGAGDVNADSFQDLVVGAYSQNLPGQGYARVISAWDLPQASATTLGLGCGTGAAPPTLAPSAPPLLGTTVTLGGANAPPGASGALVVSAGRPASVPMGYGSVLYVAQDPSAWIAVAPLSADAAGAWSLAVPLSQAAYWAGSTFTLQAAFWPSSHPLGVAITNGLRLSVGY